MVGIDLHADVDGEVRPYLTPVTAEQNLALILASYEQTPFLAAVPESDRRSAARHAGKGRCPCSRRTR